MSGEEEKNQEGKELVEYHQPGPGENMPAVITSRALALFLDVEKYALIERTAKIFADSSIVPKRFQKQLADCIIALNMANTLRVDPLMLMNNLYVVKGSPGLEAKLVISLINQSGLFSPLVFTMSGEGDGRKCVVSAKRLSDGAICEESCIYQMAIDEGWVEREYSKWPTMPDLMLKYRSVAFFSRVYCPGLTMGMHTKDELYDIIEMEENPAGEFVPAAPDRVGETVSDKLAHDLKMRMKPPDPGPVKSPPEENPAEPPAKTEPVKDPETLAKKTVPEQTKEPKGAPEEQDQGEPSQEAGKVEPEVLEAGVKPDQGGLKPPPLVLGGMPLTGIVGTGNVPWSEIKRKHAKGFATACWQNPVTMNNLQGKEYDEAVKKWYKHYLNEKCPYLKPEPSTEQKIPNETPPSSRSTEAPPEKTETAEFPSKRIKELQEGYPALFERALKWFGRLPKGEHEDEEFESRMAIISNEEQEQNQGAAPEPGTEEQGELPLG